MATQKHMGRNQIVDRLTAQVGSEKLAHEILKKRGLMNSDGTLTAKGRERNAMTAEERAIDRAAKLSGKSSHKYTYNPQTNRATLKGIK
jgi:hypothetical protein